MTFHCFLRYQMDGREKVFCSSMLIVLTLRQSSSSEGFCINCEREMDEKLSSVAYYSQVGLCNAHSASVPIYFPSKFIIKFNYDALALQHSSKEKEYIVVGAFNLGYSHIRHILLFSSPEFCSFLWFLHWHFIENAHICHKHSKCFDSCFAIK